MNLYCNQKKKMMSNFIVVEEINDALILDDGWVEYEFYPDTGQLFKFHDHTDRKTKLSGVWREM